MELKRVDVSQSSIDELVSAIECNKALTKQKKEQLEEYKGVHTVSDKVVMVPKQKSGGFEPIVPKRCVSKSKFEKEISDYVSFIEGLEDEDILSALTEEVSKDNDFSKIIMRLRAEFYRKKMEIREFLIEEYPTMNSADFCLFEEEMATYQNVFDRLSNEGQDMREESSEFLENKFIFIPTAAGNIKVLKDIESIDSSVYPGLLELFESIRTKTFKLQKAYIPHEKRFYGIREVRDLGRSLRILFAQVNPQYCAIIRVFVKSGTDDSYYMRANDIAINNYRHYLNFINDNIDNPTFIEEQEKTTKVLYDMLLSNVKNEGAVKVKKDG